MKRLWIILVIFLLPFVLFAEGAQEEKEETVEIVYANWQFLESNRKPELEGWISDFQVEYPNIIIKTMEIPFAKYDDNILTQLKGGAGPDVFRLTAFNFLRWAKEGYLEPLDEHLGDMIDSFQWTKSFNNAIIDGKTYGLLCELVPYGGLIYVKSYLEKAGAAVPKTPDQFYDAIMKLDAYAKKSKEFTFAYIHPFNLSNPVYLMQQGMIIVNGFGGLIVQDGKFTVNDDNFIAGVQYLKKLYDSGAVPVGTEFGTQRTAYLQGEAAMVLDGIYWPAIVKGASQELYEDIGVIKPPFPYDYSPYEDDWDVMNANSSDRKKDAAAKFLRFIYETGRVDNSFPISGVPAGTGTSVALAKKNNPWVDVYLNSTAESNWVDVVLKGFENETFEIRKIIADYLSEVLTGKMSAEDAMNKCQEELETRFY